MIDYNRILPSFMNVDTQGYCYSEVVGNDDPFLAAIKAATDQAQRESESVEKEVAERYLAMYGADIALCKYLTSFAIQQGLDRALVELWTVATCNPSWRQDKCAPWSRFGWTCYFSRDSYAPGDWSGGKRKKDFLCFSDGQSRFQIVRTLGNLTPEESTADFRLTENGKLVFGVKALHRLDEFGDNYSILDIYAMVREGRWALTLIDCYKMYRINNIKQDMRYLFIGADEIKYKFK